MHVGGSGPGTPAYPFDPRAKAYPPPPSLQLMHQCAPERWRPQTLGQRAELQKKVGQNGGLQQSGKIREGGCSEDHDLPWAAHTHKHTWGTHTHMHRCQNIHTEA